MKKIFLVILFLLLVVSSSYLYARYDMSNKYDKDINDIEKEIKDIKKKNEDTTNLNNEKNELDNLLDENKDRKEVYEKWQKELEKIKALL